MTISIYTGLQKAVCFAVFSGATACVSSLVLADTNNIASQSLSTAKSGNDTKVLPESPGVSLAQQELPELVSVLERLKQRAPAQFDKAVKDLDRAAKRLEALRRREPALYEQALTEWQMRARLDVMKAKHKAKPSRESEAAIESQQQAIRSMRTRQIESELASISARDKLVSERIQQMRQTIERGEQRRLQLQAELDKLSDHPVSAKASIKSNRNQTEATAKQKQGTSKSENESRE